MSDHESSNPLDSIIDARFTRVVWPISSAKDRNDILSYIAEYTNAADGRHPLFQNVHDGEGKLKDDTEKYSIGIQRIARITTALMEHLGPITIVTEPNHIDAAYRDSYYNSYAHHLTGTTRFTLRLSFFEGTLSDSGFYEATDEQLQERYLGSSTVYPVYGGLVGKTFIKPSALIEKPARLRTAPFRADVYGRTFNVEAFPYRMQDADIMSCAETTILNLLDYYAASYDGYASALPSELIELEDQDTDDRALPARGITYTTLSQVLGKCKFYPRLLSKYAITISDPTISGLDAVTHNGRRNTASFAMPSLSEGEYFIRRSVYWYLSSGIPVAINVVPDRTENPGTTPKGHSLIAIGLSELDEETYSEILPFLVDPEKPIEEDVSEAAVASIMRLDMGGQTIESKDGSVQTKKCRIYLETDITRDLVLIDDSQPPYVIRPYEKMTGDNHRVCENIVIPLHRSMGLDAQGAFEVSINVFRNPHLGVLKWADGFLREDEGILLRMSLLTAARYRRFRRNTSDFPLDRLYETIALPHFVWLVELIRIRDYEAGASGAFAELVLDASAGSTRESDGKIVIMRYPGRIIWNEPNDIPKPADLPSMQWNTEEMPSFSTFPAYYDSLREIRPDTRTSTDGSQG